MHGCIFVDIFMVEFHYCKISAGWHLCREQAMISEHPVFHLKTTLQLRQDFCTAILLFYSAVLKTIIWPRKSLKTEKRKNENDDFFSLIFEIAKLPLNMKSDQDCDLWNFLHLGLHFFSVNIIKISEKSLIIRKENVYKTITCIKISQSCLWSISHVAILFIFLI